MASYTRREVTMTWREYILPTPTSLGELGKTIAAVQADLGDDAQWDDAAEVVVRDDEIVIRYQKPA